LNGGQFVGQSSASQVLITIVIEVKPKNMARTIQWIDKKKEKCHFEVRQNVK
jgi:hypothetical protein